MTGYNEHIHDYRIVKVTRSHLTAKCKDCGDTQKYDFEKDEVKEIKPCEQKS